MINIAKQLRALPFADLMELAQVIATQINDQKLQSEVPVMLVATILSNLINTPPALSDVTKNDEKVLRELFSRKRTIVVQQQGNGWTINCPTLPGSSVIGTELRPMFAAMLDQVITLKALSR